MDFSRLNQLVFLLMMVLLLEIHPATSEAKELNGGNDQLVSTEQPDIFPYASRTYNFRSPKVGNNVHTKTLHPKRTLNKTGNTTAKSSSLTSHQAKVAIAKMKPSSTLLPHLAAGSDHGAVPKAPPTLPNTLAQPKAPSTPLHRPLAAERQPKKQAKSSATTTTASPSASKKILKGQRSTIQPVKVKTNRVKSVGKKATPSAPRTHPTSSTPTTPPKPSKGETTKAKTTKITKESRTPQLKATSSSQGKVVKEKTVTRTPGRALKIPSTTSTSSTRLGVGSTPKPATTTNPHGKKSSPPVVGAKKVQLVSTSNSKTAHTVKSPAPVKNLRPQAVVEVGSLKKGKVDPATPAAKPRLAAATPPPRSPPIKVKPSVVAGRKVPQVATPKRSSAPPTMTAMAPPVLAGTWGYIYVSN